MKKIFYGWLSFLLMPITIIGGYKIVKLATVNQTVEVVILIFSFGVIVFQFLMACSLIIQGYNDNKIRTTFDNPHVNDKLLVEQQWKEKDNKSIYR